MPKFKRFFPWDTHEKKNRIYESSFQVFPEDIKSKYKLHDLIDNWYIYTFILELKREYTASSRQQY